jgi:hypothetical protein
MGGRTPRSPVEGATRLRRLIELRGRINRASSSITLVADTPRRRPLGTAAVAVFDSGLGDDFGVSHRRLAAVDDSSRARRSDQGTG